MVLFEVCVENLNDAKKAFEMGAHRVELCSRLAEEGLTPDKNLFQEVLAYCRLNRGKTVFPMIRCRAGNFVYSEEEKSNMLMDALYFAQQGAMGLVTGALTENGDIDMIFLKNFATVVHAENPEVEITFHKAIDHSRYVDTKESYGLALQSMRGIVRRVLTSGGRATAIEGADIIAYIQQQEENHRRSKQHLEQEHSDSIIVIAAGKIRRENVNKVIEKTRVSEVHSSSALITQGVL